MNDPTRTARPSLDARLLLALSAGLAMGHVVAALAELASTSGTAMPCAVVLLLSGSAATVCALAAMPRERWVGPRFGLWFGAIGVGLLGAMAPPLLF